MILAVADVSVPPVSIAPLSEGDRGIQETVAAMQAVVADAINRPEVRALYTLRRGDRQSWPLAVERWLREHVTYHDDPAPFELLQTPGLMLAQVARRGMAYGDCDDVAMLASSLLAVADYRPVLIVIGRQPKVSGGRYEHVYYGYMIDPAGEFSPQNVMPFDPQERMTPGVWPEDFSRVAIYPALP